MIGEWVRPRAGFTRLAVRRNGGRWSGIPTRWPAPFRRMGLCQCRRRRWWGLRVEVMHIFQKRYQTVGPGLRKVCRYRPGIPTRLGPRALHVTPRERGQRGPLSSAISAPHSPVRARARGAQKLRRFLTYGLRPARPTGAAAYRNPMGHAATTPARARPTGPRTHTLSDPTPL